MTCRSSVSADVRLDTQPGAQPALKCKRRSDGLCGSFQLGREPQQERGRRKGACERDDSRRKG